MKSKVYIFLLLVFICVKYICGFCNLNEAKSSNSVQERYWSDFNRRYLCCKTVYPVLYTYVACENVNLTTGKKLPITGTSSNAKYIIFTKGEIPLIPVGVFTEFSNITELYLNNSGIKEIHPAAFNGLTNLTELNLQVNFIEKITKGTLNSLNNLKILNLFNNSINNVEEKAFLGLFNLMHLNLKCNKLDRLLPDNFDNLENLQDVDISRNRLFNISSNLFSNLNRLRNLDLSFNNVTSFEFGSLPETLKTLDLSNNELRDLLRFFNLQSIAELNLSNNRISTIQTMHAVLERLNLTRNEISSLNYTLFDDNANLISLDLSHNLISVLNENTFQSLVRLRHLYLQNNEVIRIPVGCFKDLRALTVLNLSRNQINELHYGTFAGLNALETMDLSRNKLLFLYEYSFYNLNHLEVLNIENNFMVSFQIGHLLKFVKNLKSIYLDGNVWNCESLLNVISIFEISNVIVNRGSSHTTENVKGIPCINNVSLPKLDDTITERLDQFFDKGYLNSSFYKYLENIKYDRKLLDFIENSLVNTTLDQRSLRENDLHKIFNKLTEELRSFDNQFKNSNFYNLTRSTPIKDNVFPKVDQLLKNQYLLIELLRNHLEGRPKSDSEVNEDPVINFNASGTNPEFYFKRNDENDQLWPTQIHKLNVNSNITNILLSIIIVILFSVIILFLFKFVGYKLKNSVLHKRSYNSGNNIVNEQGANVELI